MSVHLTSGYPPATHVFAPADDGPATGRHARSIGAGAIRAVIFDLDNTLADARTLGAEAFEPAFAAIRRANAGLLDGARLEAAFEACWHTAFHTVAREYAFSATMTLAGAQAFSRMEVRPGTGYGGYPDLAALGDLPAELFLVTSGFRRLQDSKVDALGIRHRFTAVEIDDAEDHWPAPSPGKAALFERIRAALGLPPHRC
jgi:phosphoglycolate phosphatase-like HAD superfamily hydrolase